MSGKYDANFTFAAAFIVVMAVVMVLCTPKAKEHSELFWRPIKICQ